MRRVSSFNVSLVSLILQQCADSIMRLDAEWRYATGRGDEITYPIGHHHQLVWKRWA